MRILNFVCGLALALVLTCTSSGQDEKKDASKDQKAPNQSMAVEMTSTILRKMVERAELDKDQTGALESIIADNVAPMVSARQVLQDMLTPEQRKTYNAALKLARNAKYDTAKAEDYALRKLKLSAEMQQKYIDAKAKVALFNNNINEGIRNLLTDEQREKLPMFATEKPSKEMSVRLRLPNMKTPDDVKAIQKDLLSVDGVSSLQVNFNNKVVNFKAPTGLKMEEQIKTFVTAGNEAFKDWKQVKLGGGQGTKAGSDAKSDASSSPARPAGKGSGAKAPKSGKRGG